MSGSTHRRDASGGPVGSGASAPRADQAGSQQPPEAAAEPAAAGEADPKSKPQAPESPPAEPAPDYRDKWLRAEADLQNFRRRASRDWEEGRRAAEEDVLIEMVSVLDDLERALDSARETGGAGAWLEGVTLVAQRLRDALARRGVTVEDPVGRAFDPAFHEALLEVDAPEGIAPGAVVQVVHKGYRRGDRALRAARVVVARSAAGGSA